MLIGLLAYLINWLIDAYIFVLFVRMLIDWAFVLAPRWYPHGLVGSLVSIVYQLTEPPLRWLRRYIPPLPLGRIQLDVSFVLLWFLLIVLQVLVNALI
ncbi:putative integral membrane protein [Bifidobacterium actinocoloniiforme DSM 22766]|uniref:Putative integral membrane protein n=1 Tax=Bifidobacterium actinocoloniiforme DSM 22766 TaxID=1437605 RepID=A0A086YZP6_9BIFI|nr:YggT family protein [Bifidobacterium actinocoloniiforme]AKV55052.1 hemolysin [Bifidobacterium actinocoloniiforme DSM 22766]KFI39746.1 putative integral membrane protein [Bifidobacterium actinocoloniiforme DSM 22766]